MKVSRRSILRGAPPAPSQGYCCELASPADFSCDCALKKGNGAGEGLCRRGCKRWGCPTGYPGAPRLSPAPWLWEEPGSGCTSPRGSPAPGLGPHPAPPQRPSGPECEAWPALLLGFEVLFLYDERKRGQTKWFLKKALLLTFFFIYVCVFMIARRRGFQGQGLV